VERYHGQHLPRPSEQRRRPPRNSAQVRLAVHAGGNTLWMRGTKPATTSRSRFNHVLIEIACGHRVAACDDRRCETYIDQCIVR
jgi:hypothetical protein